MEFLGFTIKYWIAVTVTIIIKVLTSETKSCIKIIVTVLSSFLLAYIGTVPAMDFFNLDPVKYTELTAVAIALTAESIVRWITKLTPEDILERWKK